MSTPTDEARPSWWGKRWSTLDDDEASAALASYQAEIEAAATARAST